MDILWYIIIGIIIIIIIYYIMRLFTHDNMTNTSNDMSSYLSEMIKLNGKMTVVNLINGKMLKQDIRLLMRV